MARCFEEYSEGEVLVSPGRTITEADVVGFAALSGDWNEIHTNEEFARKGHYGRRIAHGALIFSISMGLASRNDRSKQPDLIAFYGVDRLRFVKPVFLGDTIHLKQTVLAPEPRDAGSGIVNLKHQVFNQDGVLVTSYTAKLLVHRRQQPEPS
jgi:3-hydroxybutyryl-CoA dehydratase